MSRRQPSGEPNGEVSYVYKSMDRYQPDRVARYFKSIWTSAARAWVASEFAASIEKADTEAGASWELSLLSDLLRLNVGQVEVLRATWDGIMYVVDTSIESLGISRTHLFLEANPVYKAVPIPSQSFFFGFSELRKYAAIVRPAHNSFIAQAANRKKVSPFQKSHSPAAVQHLSLVTGEGLPQPSYFEKPRA